MTQTEAPTTITEHRYHTQSGYTVTVQQAECENCAARIERVKVRPGKPAAIWGHPSTGRAVCLLPADTSKMATPR